jgi:phosphoglycolate phosphatase
MDRWKQFKAQAIIFDKDGTLIDFDAMWGGWVLYLAEQLRLVSGLNVHEALCVAMGYDDKTKRVLANGKLASRPMSQLYQVTVEAIQSFGVRPNEAECIVEKAWCIPDPVLLAKPFTNTRALFSSLYDRGIQIAIATADDRAPTRAMVEALDIAEFVTTMVCADDGIPSKPAPDMVLTISERLNLVPKNVMVIGDTASDLKMGRAAGAGLVVGVLSGVSSTKDLIPYAHLLIESIDELHDYILQLDKAKAAHARQGFDPDFAF